MTAAAERWRDLVDLERLAAWMDSQGLGDGPILDPTPLTGGSQNVLLHFSRGDRAFVLRRPPADPYRDGSDTMRREARILKALAGTGVPHARLIAAGDDAEILGAAFYLMEPVSGFNARLGLPALHAGDPAVRHGMGLALADGIAALATVDYVAVGLADMGRPEGFLERQVGRWRKQLESYRDYAGWSGPASLPHVDAVAAWLEANRPAASRPGIMHGDYHFANVLYRFDGPGLAAIVDWEIATIGDPLVDLGWLLATWPDPDGGGPVFRITPWEGFPTAAELVKRYAERSGSDVSAALWYSILGCYKLAILVEGTFARSLAGKADAETGKTLHGRAVALLDRARRWIVSA